MILAVKTDGMAAELFLLDHSGHKLQQEVWQSGRELSEGLMTHVLDLLKQQKAAPKDLTGIIVYEGPGSFTSLRIGLTVANTIAYAQSIPIVGTSGQEWIKNGLTKLKTTQPGNYVMPQYGAEANITKPKK